MKEKHKLATENIYEEENYLKLNAKGALSIVKGIRVPSAWEFDSFNSCKSKYEGDHFCSDIHKVNVTVRCNFTLFACLFGGHTYLFSGLIPCSLLRDHTW